MAAVLLLPGFAEAAEAKKTVIMRALESRGIEFNAAWTGGKLHQLLLNSLPDAVKPKTQDDIPAPTDDDAPSEAGHKKFMDTLPLTADQDEKAAEIENGVTVSDFGQLVETDEWQEMSVLQKKHPETYMQVTNGEMPRNLDEVNATIDAIYNIIEGQVNEGMPEA